MLSFDVLANHLKLREVVPSTFLPCDTLPPLFDLDINGRHVERIAHRLKGAVGSGGSSAMQWHNYLLRHGHHSAQLRDCVAMLAHRLANGIVEWHEIWALVANRVIALDKCPGVRPIGIGKALQRILGKTAALVTH